MMVHKKWHRCKSRQKKMESEYRALLEKAVADPDTGTPWAPNMTSVIMDQFNILRDELLQEKDTNQKLIDDANDVIKACNSGMKTRYEKKVLPLRGSVTGLRDDHTKCRGIQSDNLPDREVQCKPPKFANQDNPTVALGHSPGVQDLCSADQDFYAESTKTAWTGDKSDYQGGVTLSSAIVQANKCVDYLEQWKACNNTQSNFEEAFCEYSLELRDTCSDHDECHADAVVARNELVAKVLALEGEQKMVWTSLQKIFCYMGHLVKLEKERIQPTAADIAACTKYQPTTTPLDIERNKAEDIEDKAKCDKSTVEYQPGDSNWRQDEYESKDYYQPHIGKPGEMRAVSGC